MNNNKIREGERYLKRVLKRKMAVTEGLLVAFMIAGFFGLSLDLEARWTTQPLKIDGDDHSRIAGFDADGKTGDGSVIFSRADRINKNLVNSVVIGIGGNKPALPGTLETQKMAINIEGYDNEHPDFNSGIVAIGAVRVQSNPHGVGRTGTGGQAVAIGNDVTSTSQAVAIGNNTYALGGSSIAIGNDDIETYRDKVTNYDYNNYLKPLYDKIDSGRNAYGIGDAGNAIYSPNVAGGEGSISIGSRTVAYKPGSTALGTLAYALGQGATALGTQSRAEGTGSIAIGNKTRNFANQALAVGNDSQILKTGGTAVGLRARSGGDGSIAIGTDVYANVLMKTDDADMNNLHTYLRDRAMGTKDEDLADTERRLVQVKKSEFGNKDMVDANGLPYRTDRAGALLESKIENGVAKYYRGNQLILDKDTVLATDSIAYHAIVADTTAHHDINGIVQQSGKNAIAIGTISAATGENSLVLGRGSFAMADNAFAVGSYSYANSKNSMAIGTSARAIAENSITLGAGSVATAAATNSTVIGTKAGVAGANSSLVGSNSEIFGNDSIAFGNRTKISKVNNTTDTSNNIAVGNDIRIGAGVTNSMAYGKGASIGQYEKPTPQEIAAGKLDVSDNNKITNSTAFGNGAKVIREYNGTVTPESNLSDIEEAAKDPKFMHTGNNAMAIGNNSRATLENSVALGVKSSTDYSYSDLMQPGWTARGSIAIPTSGQTGVISVGAKGAERRIVNVASGFRDTDAVNVIQLRTLEETVTRKVDNIESGMHYLSVNKKGPTNVATEPGSAKVTELIERSKNYDKYITYKIQYLQLQARQNWQGEKFNQQSVDEIKTLVENLERDPVISEVAKDLKNQQVGSKPAGKSGAEAYSEFVTALENLRIKLTKKVRDVGKENSTLEADKTPYERLLEGVDIKELEKETNYSNEGAQGTDSLAVGFRALAVKDESKINAERAIAMGYKAKTSAKESISIGDESNVGKNAERAIAMGYKAQADGARSLSLGAKAESKGELSIAIGSNEHGKAATTASGKQSIAFGSSAKATAEKAMAMGPEVEATNKKAIAIGSKDENITKASGENAIAIGAGAQVSGGWSVGIGSNVKATSNTTIAIGDRAEAKDKNAVALGAAAKANIANSVALGQGTEAKASTGNSYLTNRTLSDTGKVVAVGSRRITQVEDGAQDDDAVNVRQLKKAAPTLQAQNSNGLAGDKLATNPGATIKVQADSFTISNTRYEGGNLSTFIGGTADAPVVSIGLRKDPTFETLKLNTGAEGASNLTLSSDNAGNLNVGSKKITGVADGTENNDAVNYSQLNGVKTTAEGAKTAAEAAQTTANAANTAVTSLGNKQLTFAANSGNITRKLGETIGIKGDNSTISTSANATNNEITIKVKDSGIGTTQLANNAVTDAKLANNAVTAAKIKDGAVTENKLESNLKDKINKANTVAGNNIRLTGDSETAGGAATKTGDVSLAKAGGVEFAINGKSGEIVTKASETKVEIGLSETLKTKLAKLDNLDANANDKYATKDELANKASTLKIKSGETTETLNLKDDTLKVTGSGDVTVSLSNKEFTVGLSEDAKKKLDNVSAKSDGKDKKDSSKAENADSSGNKGLTKEDKLNGKDLTDKVNALRNGEAGTVVFTDKDGNRLVKANDGKYYKPEFVAENGDVKEGVDPNKGIANPELRVVNAEGSTTTPNTLNNVASGLGLDGKKTGTNPETDYGKPISVGDAQAVVKGLATQKEGLNKAATVRDLQALTNAGLTFEANTVGDTKISKVDRKLGETLKITGDGIKVSKNATNDGFVFSLSKGKVETVNVKDKAVTSAKLAEDARTVVYITPDNKVVELGADGKLHKAEDLQGKTYVVVKTPAGTIDETKTGYYADDAVNADGELKNPETAQKLDTPAVVDPAQTTLRHALNGYTAGGTDITTKSVLTNVGAGTISDKSTDAINGSQLNAVATSIGLTVGADNKTLTLPALTKLKDAKGNDVTTAPTTIVGGLNAVTDKVNEGIQYNGDLGTKGTQQLGTVFNVNKAGTDVELKDGTKQTISKIVPAPAGSAEGTLPTIGTEEIDRKYVGKNIITQYTKNTDGSGKLEIGFAESPEFKNVKADNVTTGSIVFDDGAGHKLSLGPTSDGKLQVGGKEISTELGLSKNGSTEDGKVDLAKQKLQVVGEKGVSVDIANQKVTVSLDTDTKAKIDNIGKKSDGRDDKDSTSEENKDSSGNKGLTKEDKLNGKDLTDKVNALRNGEAGTVVFTDKDGNRLVKANDGNYYKADKVKADGNLVDPTDAIRKATNGKYYKADRLKADGNLKDDTTDADIIAYNPELRVVNTDGTTTNPIKLNNIASALEAVREPNKAVTAEKAQEAVKALLAKTEGLDKAVNLADLQAVAQAGLDFTGNAGSTHRALGTTLTIKGKDGVTYDDTYTTDNVATNVKTDGTVEIGFKKSPTFTKVTADELDVKKAKIKDEITFDKGDGKPTTIVAGDGNGSLLVNGKKVATSDSAPVLYTNENGAVVEKGLDNKIHLVSELKGKRFDKASNKYYAEDQYDTAGKLKENAQEATFTAVDPTKVKHALASIADGSVTSAKVLSNVGEGTADNDAVNVKQLNALKTNKIKLTADGETPVGGGDKINKETTALNLDNNGGISFGIKGADGIETTASGTDVTVKLSKTYKDKLDNLDNNAKDTYAKKDATNITKANAAEWKKALGLEKAVSGTGTLSIDAVTKGTEANAEEKAKGTATVKLDGTENFKLVGTDGITVTGDATDKKTLTFGLDQDTKDAIKNIGKSTSDGRDGKDGRDGTNGTNGSHGLTAKDGLNGKDLTDKVNALRNGEAGTVVFTDKDGNRLVKANDGKYYKPEFVSPDGSTKANENGDQPVAVDNPELRTVNSDGTTTKPIALNNIASALGLDGKKPGVTPEANYDKPISETDAKKVMDALIKKDSDLNKAVTLRDLQALAVAGLDFTGNSGTTHRALGTALNIVGKTQGTDFNEDKFNETYTTDNVATNVKTNGTVEIGFKKSPTFKDVTADNIKATGNIEGKDGKFENLKVTEKIVTKEIEFKDGSGNNLTLVSGKDGNLYINGVAVPSAANAPVIYTDKDGNRVELGQDGKVYTPEKLNGLTYVVTKQAEGTPGTDGYKPAVGAYYAEDQFKKDPKTGAYEKDDNGNRILKENPQATNLDGKDYTGTVVHRLSPIKKGDTAPRVLTNVGEGKISADSKDAVNGSQIKNVLDKMGVEIDSATGEIKQPTITAIKGADGTDGTTPTTLKDGLNAVITKVNEGIKYAGDSGSGTQQLGTVFNVNRAAKGTTLTETIKATAPETKDTTINYVGDNLITKYVKDATGNGKLEIGFKESPTFKDVTADSVTTKTLTFDDGKGHTLKVGPTKDGSALKIGDKEIATKEDVILKLTKDGTTDNGSVDLSTQKLKVVGEKGVTVDIANQKVTVSLDADTKSKIDNIGKIADGKDGINGKDGATPNAAQNGLTGKDGLNGKDLTTKVNALRNGEAGTVVFTDKDGNRLVKANDGNYYKADKVNDNGTLKNEADAIKKANDGNYYLASQVGADGNVITPEGGAKPAPQEYSPELRTVNNDGTTTKPIALNNIASALGLDGKKPGVTPEANYDKPISETDAKKVMDALIKKDSDLNKAVTLRDLQALAVAGLDFTGNTGTVHRALGTALNVVGQGTPAADFAGASNNINVVASEVEDQNTKAKITKLEIQLAKALQNIESIQNGDTKVTLGKDGVSVSGQDGKATVGINGGNGTDGASVSVNGKDGKDGVTIKGTDGTNGSSIVVNGKDGKDGVTIKGGDGTNGATITFDKKADGTGTGSITGLKDPELENGKPKDPTAATTVNYVTNQIEGAKTAITNNIKNIVDGGMTYKGNSGEDVKVKLNEAVNIKGEGDYTGTGSATGNIAVLGNNKNSTLEIKLNKDLKNIDSISSKDNATKIALGENGVSISGKDGNSTVAINGGNGTNGASVVINGKDGQNGKDGVTIKGSDGTNGSSVAINGKDGKDGITIKGGNGTDGATVTFGKKDDGTGTGSITGLKDPDKTDKTAAATVNYVNNEINNVTNNINNAVEKMNKGLNFVGNDNEKVNAKLDGTVSIKGEGTVPTGTNTAANNIKVEKDTTDKSTGLVVKLADKLTGMTSFETKDGVDGKVKIDKDGISLSKDNKPTLKIGADGTITGVKVKDGDKTSVATVEYVESKIGSGMTFGGDKGSEAQKLGTTLEVKAATEKITAAVKEEKDGKIVAKAGETTTYTGKNLTTTYTLDGKTGTGTISVAMTERPEYEKVTVGTGDKKMTLDGTAGSIEFAKSNPTKQVYADNNGNIIKYKDENGEIKVIERNVGTGSVTGLKDVETVTVDGEKIAVDRTQAATAGYVDEKVADAKNEVRTIVNQVDKNAQRIEEVNKQAKEGIASVAAMATLDFNDAPVGRVGVGAAIGGYRGTQAVAVGAVYGINESFKVNAKMGIPTSRPNGATYGVSATYYFDR